MTTPKQKLFKYFIAPVLIALQFVFIAPNLVEAAPGLPFPVQGQVLLNGVPADGASVTVANARTAESTTTLVGAPGLSSGWYYVDLGNFVTPGANGDTINITASLSGQTGNTSFIYNPSLAFTVPPTINIGTSTPTSTLPGTIAITPINPSILAGATQQFSATALNGDGTTNTSTISWSSSNTAVVTINSASGLANGVSVGSAVIRASNAIASSTTNITVTASSTPTTTASISISPVNPNIMIGTNQQFTSVALDSNGQPDTTTLTWASNNPAILSINATSGLANALAIGQATITASNANASRTTTVNVVSTSTPTSTFGIFALAGVNGSIAPSGTTMVSLGGSQTYTVTPNPGYSNSGLLIDGISIGPVNTYTFTNVTTSHTIAVDFFPTTSTTSTPLLSISTASLPAGNVGVQYSQRVQASSTNLSDILTWSVATGTLPAGLSLNTATGLISGAPTTAGTSTFTIQVAGNNASSTPVSRSFTLNINLLGTVLMVQTDRATAITSSTATLNGQIISTGGMPITTSGFRYGTSTAYGFTAVPNIGGTATGTFSANITGLSGNVPYHFQAFASNASGTVSGADQLLRAPIMCTISTTIAVLDGSFNGPTLINIEADVSDCLADLRNLILASSTPMSATLLGDLHASRFGSIGELQLIIPAGTRIVGNTTSWDGMLRLPRMTPSSTIKAPVASGFNNTIHTIFDVGGNVDLSLNQPIQLVVPGQASGRKVFYADSTGSFNISQCSGTGNTLGADQKECFFYDGTNIGVRTTHFSTYGTYSQVAISTGGGSSGGSSSGGGGGISVTQPFSTPVSQLSVKINNGALTTQNQEVTLTLDGKTEAKKMAISNSTDFSDAFQENYATKTIWTLTRGNGAKTVYVKFYNSFGYASPVVSSTIQLEGQSGSTNTNNQGTVEVLNKYKNGYLLRDATTKKIYVLYNNKLKHILNLTELRKYRGRKVYDVSPAEINAYPITTVDPFSSTVVSYADGMLVRDSNTKRIYVVSHGQLVYIPTLQELRKYRGKRTINVTSGILARYQ